MLEFQKQNCQLTLEEGLEIYYNAFEDQESILKGDTLPEFIFGHDCTHVIFGLGLSLKEEAILDTYTIYGCKNSLKIIFKAAGQIFKSKELLNLYKKLISEHGLIGLLKLVNSSKKSKKIARIKTKKMKKKWSYIVPKSYLSFKINDLRDEYGISVLTEKELGL
tara:strand:+ start:21 stop:512 length:492 start_codon:yes stop_codon:yes gene_type:complete